MRGRQGKIWLAVLTLIAACVCAQSSSVYAKAGEATAAMKSTIDQVVGILENEELKKPERADERRVLLKQAVGARFDYDEMTKRSLGKQWSKLDDAQRREFVQLFTDLLAASYANKIEGYSGEQIQYLNERTKGKYAEVKTKVVSGKTKIPLDYRLMYRSNEWRVYDVVVDGVSLVRNYRGQFSKILRSESYEELLRRLREKVEKSSSS